MHSRLDMFLVSQDLQFQKIKALIHPSIKSDHSLIEISFVTSKDWVRGKGFYKFNTSLLKDKFYVDMINKEITELENENKSSQNKVLFWDYCKCKFRGLTISYSSFKSKQKMVEAQLSAEVESLEQVISETPSLDLLNRYQETKQLLEEIHITKAKGHLTRSRAQDIEENEKCSKYFLSIKKRNYNSKCIKCLETPTGNITEEIEILNEEKAFYQNLYSTTTASSDNSIETSTKELLSNPNLPKLSEIDRALCDQAISIEECSKALQGLSNNKSPGCDGIPVEFYKFFWSKIKNFVFNSFVWSLQSGELSDDQKRGVVTLVPKKDKNLCQLKNWRPISLLNTDYKILTKLFASRLQKILGKIINPDQVGYIKGRFIGEVVCTIRDLINLSSSSQKPGLLTLLDFEKAFDSVSWSFLLKCLKAFNFGNNFIAAVKMLYNNIESCVTNNEKASQFFKLYRGIRQGCCLSALLFLLVVEVLAIDLRSNESIKGITINNIEYKICQLADDTTLFSQDEQSVKLAFHRLDLFGQCSGLKLNKSKTEIIALGGHGDKQKLNQIKKGPFKVLGVWFSENN